MATVMWAVACLVVGLAVGYICGLTTECPFCGNYRWDDPDGRG